MGKDNIQNYSTSFIEKFDDLSQLDIDSIKAEEFIRQILKLDLSLLESSDFYLYLENSGLKNTDLLNSAKQKWQQKESKQRRRTN